MSITAVWGAKVTVICIAYELCDIWSLSWPVTVCEDFDLSDFWLISHMNNRCCV